MRYSAISPDGETVAFSYQGDIYLVSTTGGEARPITLHNAHDFMPVWSHDGSQIAFASDRYSNYDVYVMPSTGGQANRVTFHSAGDYPSDFTQDDQHIIFSSSRLDVASNQQFPSGVLPELYKVSVDGGRVAQVMTTPAQDARYSRDGKKIVFHDRKGYEDQFRKHHTSSVTRDVWMYDIETKSYTQLSKFNGEDRNPIFTDDDKSIIYLSEKDGTSNIYKMTLENGSEEQLTSLENHPVRYLSVSDDGLMCFSYDGELYTLKEGSTPKKINVSIAADRRYNAEEVVKVNSKISQMDLSPNGKEIAYIYRGEVFVSSVKEGTTKRITSTPEQERSVNFSPDGRSLVYAGERDASWNIYETSIKREDEKYFFNATLLDEKIILESEEETFQPKYSPDGKEVAFIAERTAVKVINKKSKVVREIMPASMQYSYSDGDQYYDWAPDGKHLAVNMLPNKRWTDQIGLVSAQGGEIKDLSQSGYGAYAPRWMMDGKILTFLSGRDGMKNHGSWGSQMDIYAMFLTQEAYDEFVLSEEEYELMKEEEKDEDESGDEKGGDKKKKKDDKSEKEDELKPVKIELENIDDRKVRLTIHSSNLGDFYVTDDGKSLFYLARFEKGYDLWKTDLRTRETKIHTKLNGKSGGQIIADKKDENLFILSNGKISKVGIKDGKSESVSINGEMILTEQEERAYIFEHIWRQVEDKFYKVDLHDVKWDFYKEAYAKFLPHINNNTDFAEMLSEMLGELNASHTGARYRNQDSDGYKTASLGVFYDDDYTGKGLRVSEVMDKSPIVKAGSKIKAGTVIEKIDGIELTSETNHYKLLNRKNNKNTLLALYNPSTKERWEETVKPISLGKENELRYQRWVKKNREMVDKLSDGKVGYVHVRGMNDRSFRTVYDDVLGKNHSKDALIVDTRFNGGGWLHDDLATFLNGKNYITFMPRDQDLGNEPQFKWTKPSIVVMSESNYSDAHMFPYTYRALGIGKLLGMPVPGTGTAVWWERLQNGMVFGIPQVGMVDVDGDYLENKQLEPDIKVSNDPGEVIKGRDQQLEEAVKEMLKQTKVKRS